MEPGMCPAPLRAPAHPELECLPSPCQGLSETGHAEGRKTPVLLPWVLLRAANRKSTHIHPGHGVGDGDDDGDGDDEVRGGAVR